MQIPALHPVTMNESFCVYSLFTGSYVSNRVSDKLTPLANRIYVCRSGSAADTQAIADYTKTYLGLHAYVNLSF